MTTRTALSGQVYVWADFDGYLASAFTRLLFGVLGANHGGILLPAQARHAAHLCCHVRYGLVDHIGVELALNGAPGAKGLKMDVSTATKSDSFGSLHRLVFGAGFDKVLFLSSFPAYDLRVSGQPPLRVERAAIIAGPSPGARLYELESQVKEVSSFHPCPFLLPSHMGQTRAPHVSKKYFIPTSAGGSAFCTGRE